MIIQQIRNATLVVNYAGKKFVIDAWFQKKGEGMSAPTPWPEKNSMPSPMVNLPISVDEIMADVDAIIVTHIHPDHFDPETAEMIDKKIPIFTQDEDTKIQLEKIGYRTVYVLSDAGTVFEGVTLTRTQGQHGLSPDRTAGPVCGVVFSAPEEKVLYIAGDTVYYDGVLKELELHKPDIIVLNACGAELIGIGRLIMGKEDVLSVCHAASSAVIICSHMDTVNHATVTRKELLSFLAEHGVAEQVLIPEDGEIYHF